MLASMRRHLSNSAPSVTGSASIPKSCAAPSSFVAEAACGRACCGVASFSGGAASRLALACNIRPCRSELVTSDGITAFDATALKPAATIALADDLASNFASMIGAGNAARAFVRTAVTFSGMALNASATLAFGVATLGRDTAI